MRILGRDEALYTGLAHRNRAAATASSFGVAANVEVVLARRVQRALVGQCPLITQSGPGRALRQRRLTDGDRRVRRCLFGCPRSVRPGVGRALVGRAMA